MRNGKCSLGSQPGPGEKSKLRLASHELRFFFFLNICPANFDSLWGPGVFVMTLTCVRHSATVSSHDIGRASATKGLHWLRHESQTKQ